MEGNSFLCRYTRKRGQGCGCCLAPLLVGAACLGRRRGWGKGGFRVLTTQRAAARLHGSVVSHRRSLARRSPVQRAAVCCSHTRRTGSDGVLLKDDLGAAPGGGCIHDDHLKEGRLQQGRRMESKAGTRWEGDQLQQLPRAGLPCSSGASVLALCRPWPPTAQTRQRAQYQAARGRLSRVSCIPNSPAPF